MRRQKLVLIAIVLLVIPAIALSLYFSNRIMTVEDAITRLLDNDSLAPLADFQPEEIKNLGQFYQARKFAPFWLDHNELNLEAQFLLKNLSEAGNEGLDASGYFSAAIAVRQQSKDLVALGELDVLLSAAFNRFANHLHHGRIAPLVATSGGEFVAQDIGLALLAQSSGENNLFSLLYKQAPSYEQYDRLRKKLFEYRDLASKGGWAILPIFHALKQGMDDNRIVKLRQRLKISGDLPSTLPDTQLFDNDVKKAVSSFQARYDLPVTGIATPETIQALNVPVDARIRQILVNMERWHALPHDFGTRYVLVNSAGSEFVAAKNSRPNFAMRAVSADSSKPALFAAGKINKIVLSPRWLVPASIVKDDIIAKHAQDPLFLAQNGYRLVKTNTMQLLEQTITDAVLADIGNGQSEYQLVKLPDKNNPLGRVQFSMNELPEFSLHDTAYRNLFSNNYQYANYGSIAIENPWRLANFLLSSDSAWNNAKMHAVLQEMKTTDIVINEPIDIYIIYVTAWVDDKNQIGFHTDFQKRDEKIAAFLNLN